MALIKGKQIGSQTVTISGSTGNVIVSGLLDTNGNQVYVNVAPTSDQHLTNKAYVDAVAQGIRPHPPVVVVSTNNIDLIGLETIDSVSLTGDERVLVAGQTDTTENGLYLVKSTEWVRTEDADGTPDNEVQLGDFVFVTSGTTNGNSGWVLGKSNTSTPPDITPDTDTQEWYKMAAPGSYSADGEGLELNGSEFSLELDGITLTKSATGLKVNDTLSTAISSNTTNITSLDNALSSEISATNSDFTSLETEIGTLDTELSTEVSNRISGDTSLETAIGTLDTELSTEVSNRISGDSSLTSALSSGISTTNSEITSLNSELSTEVSNRISGDSSLETAISTLSGDTTDITTILNDGEVLGLSGGELTGFTYNTDITSLSSELSTEISTTDSEVTSLSTAISGNTTDSTSLSTALSTEISTTDSEVTSLSIGLSTEVSNRISGDGSLSSVLSTEISTTDSEVTSLSSAISDSNGDSSSLSTALSTEISTTNSEVTSLDSELSTEVSNRISGDDSLASEIGTLETAFSDGAASLSTGLSTEVSNRISGDGSLETEIGTLDTELSTEISNRISGDDSLTTAIDDISDYEVISETITPANSGSTSNVVVSTTAFGYGSGVVDVDSVTVFLNGIQYPFAYASGTSVFHTNSNTPDGNNTTLYFDGTVAGFAIETDDTVIIKYMVVT